MTTERITADTPKPGQRVKVQIGRQVHDGKLYRSGWRVGTVVEHHEGIDRDGVTVRLLDGSEWPWCSVRCIKAHGKGAA